jgi:adenosine deaminase
MAVRDDRLLAALAERHITLELCPTSNLRTGAVRDMDEYCGIFQRFHEYGVKYCINTDGPEMLHTDLVRERAMLLDHGALNQSQLDAADRQAREATFIRVDNA